MQKYRLCFGAIVSIMNLGAVCLAEKGDWLWTH